MGVSPKPIGPEHRPAPAQAPSGVTLSAAEISEGKLVWGPRYSPDEFDKQASKIPGAPRLGQPGWTQVAGAPVFVWVAPHYVSLRLCGADGDYHAVSRKDLANARKIEEALARARLRWIDPPTDSPRCFCPRRYPGAFPEA